MQHHRHLQLLPVVLLTLIFTSLGGYFLVVFSSAKGSLMPRNHLEQCLWVRFVQPSLH